jgi:hypothetical protein
MSCADPELENWTKKKAPFSTRTLPVTTTFSKSQVAPAGTTTFALMVLLEIVVLQVSALATGMVASKMPSTGSMAAANLTI